IPQDRSRRYRTTSPGAAVPRAPAARAAAPPPPARHPAHATERPASQAPPSGYAKPATSTTLRTCTAPPFLPVLSVGLARRTARKEDGQDPFITNITTLKTGSSAVPRGLGDLTGVPGRWKVGRPP